MDTIAALAAKLGISTPVAPFPSSAIGASAVRPIELVTAYTAFANTGPLATPRLLLRVQDAAGRTYPRARGRRARQHRARPARGVR